MKKIFYRVVKGDSVLSIAQQFNLSVTSIIKTNNLTCEVEEGDILYLQCGEYRLYKVQPTDTLCSIAKKFNVSEHDILLNNCIEYVFYGLTIMV